MRRLIAIVVVALLAAPGTWLRSPPPPAVERTSPEGWSLVFQPLQVDQRQTGEARIAGGWVLESDYPGFGSYSALVTLGEGRLFAGSDTGGMLGFAAPGSRSERPQMGRFAGRRQPNKYLADIEGMTRDPVTGRVWVSYEGRNAIERFEPGFTGARQVRPVAMRDWPGNTGPETLLRLSDGRFLVLSEARSRWFGSEHPALLFPSDPVEGAAPIQFAFESSDGFRPVDAAELPDGRVALLMRRFDWLPPGFQTRVLIADPAEIRPGGRWTARTIAAIDMSGPAENYEGLAVEPLSGEAVRLWLISDANRSAIQRTQLLALDWRPQ